MGYLVAEPRTQVHVIAYAVGKGNFLGESHAKAGLWILADKTGVFVTNDPTLPGGVKRQTFTIDRVEYHSAQQTYVAYTPAEEQVTLDARGCGCGMGAIQGAGPVEGQYEVIMERIPEDWYTVLP